MAGRSISDEEISLIKAMLDRGYKNKEIQFYFNRPGRPVNSGRISGILSGDYSNSIEIAAASQGELDRFLEKLGHLAHGATLEVEISGPGEILGPLHTKTLATLFSKDVDGYWKLSVEESDRHECKENFGFKHADKWLKAIAAMANNSGGYIFFGVRDKIVDQGIISKDSYRVVGLSNNDFTNADPSAFTKRMKSIFDPTPKIEIGSYYVGEKNVGVIYIYQHPSRPVIATKQEASIGEGDIFYRYPGQSSRIKYSDLRSVLDERDRNSRDQLIPLVAKLFAIGPQNAMVADLNVGQLSDSDRTIVIGEHLLEQIKFIREGEFNQKQGAATLRLVGDVVALSGTSSVARRAFVTPANLMEDFLNQSTVYDPQEYIRCAVEGANGAWVPMHYYAKEAGLSKSELAKFIMGTKGSLKRRKDYAARATGKTSAYNSVGSKGLPGVMLEKIKAGEMPEINDLVSAANFGRALAALELKPLMKLEEMLDAAKISSAVISDSSKPHWMTSIRRGVARLDELYFSGK